jgi:hypothetical protein
MNQEPAPEPNGTEPSYELFQQFVEHLAAQRSPHGTGTVRRRIRSSLEGADSLEEAIGQAVVAADQIAHEETRIDLWALWQIPREFLHHMTARRIKISVAASGLVLAAMASLGVVMSLGSTAPASYRAPESSSVSPAGGNAQLLGQAPGPGQAGTSAAVSLPTATAAPTPAPPSLADAAPLRPHEVFGFAPYWTLSQSAGFNVAGISTLAYFSIGVNGDGSLAQTGPGWNGFESQALADLVTRAHGAGDRVVLAVDCFDQSELNQLTSSTTAPSTLATALIGAIETKNLDGVNLDFEGQGSGDQAGLTNLVTQVSAAIHAVNPHYQVTMDTYASSAGDSNGFYNIKALAPAVDGFFVMEYQLNLQSVPSATSPLTSVMFSDKATIDQYAAAVPPSKVILGMPYFGIDWPTSDGTLTAQATGPATDVSYGQVLSSGHPLYWDATTDTGWTSYLVGTQWHETFFEDPASLYAAAQMATQSGLGGMGIWALGMDGNDPSMLSALGGFAPATKSGPAGPAATSQSTPTSTTTTAPNPVGVTTTGNTGDGTTSTDSTASPYTYTAQWEGQGQTVTLNLVQGADIPPVQSTSPVGQLQDFTTDDPATSCLGHEPFLEVLGVSGNPAEFLVIVSVANGDCTTADFTFTTS